MTEARVLIACIGNIFLGDDGFGVEVARRMVGSSLPDGVVLKDFGIRGLDLTYALMEPWKLVILVDACQRGGEPGSIYVIEPDLAELETPEGDHITFEAHAMNPMNVLRAVKAMGGSLGRVLIAGCEPADLGEEEGRLGLSGPVTAAIGEAIGLIESLSAQAVAGESIEEILQVN